MQRLPSLARTNPPLRFNWVAPVFFFNPHLESLFNLAPFFPLHTLPPALSPSVSIPSPSIPFIPLLFPHFFRLLFHSLPLLSLFLRIPRSRCAVCSTPDKTDRGGNANRVLAAAEMARWRFECLAAGQGWCWFDTVFPCVTYMQSVRLAEHRLREHIEPVMCY